MAESVRLMHYDPRWRQQFEQTRSSVLMSCMGWVSSIEHVGSTAISGLIARPVIDVLAGVVDPEGVGEAVTLIEGLNYRGVPLPTWCDDGVLLVKPRHGRQTHRIFLTHIDSLLWHRMLRVRNWLRDHPSDAVRFEDAKVHRWKCSDGDPVAYEQGKAIFFAHLEDQIATGYL